VVAAAAVVAVVVVAVGWRWWRWWWRWRSYTMNGLFSTDCEHAYLSIAWERKSPYPISSCQAL